MQCVIAYEIADDQRREDVATVLSGYAPCVQLSIFECEIPSSHAAAETIIIDARANEVRQDFWIVQ